MLRPDRQRRPMPWNRALRPTIRATPARGRTNLAKVLSQARRLPESTCDERCQGPARPGGTFGWPGYWQTSSPVQSGLQI